MLEYLFAQALLFTAFGVGLDPRQSQVFGAALGPILVGVILGVSTLASGISKPGYTGVCKRARGVLLRLLGCRADGQIGANPARCLGLMTAKNDVQYLHILWLGDLAACMTNGLFYYFIPPYVHRRGM